MSAGTYDIGDTARVNFQAVDPATGLPVDTTVTWSVSEPVVLGPTAAVHYGPAGSGTYYAAIPLTQAGVWRGKFDALVGGDEPFVLIIAADSTLVPWSPTLTQVGDYVPGRTRPITPGAGDDAVLGTFSTLTRPTGEQVARLAAAATAYVAGAVGTVDASLYVLATAAAAQRAAAYVELAFPERDADLNTAESLLALADKTLDRLAAANLAVSGVSVGSAALPVWSFPDPPAWGDVNL